MSKPSLVSMGYRYPSEPEQVGRNDIDIRCCDRQQPNAVFKSYVVDGRFHNAKIVGAKNANEKAVDEKAVDDKALDDKTTEAGSIDTTEPAENGQYRHMRGLIRLG